MCVLIQYCMNVYYFRMPSRSIQSTSHINVVQKFKVLLFENNKLKKEKIATNERTLTLEQTIASRDVEKIKILEEKMTCCK